MNKTATNNFTTHNSNLSPSPQKGGRWRGAFNLYQILIAYPLSLVWTIFICLTIILGSLLGLGKWAGYYPGAWWGYGIIRLFLLPVKVEGRENLQPGQSYVFVANHQGCFDIFLVFGFLRRNFRWMMKSSLGDIPIFGQACKRSQQILVDNRSASKIKRSYDQARRILRGGPSLVVFPEGARTKDGQIHTFKRGAYLLADELQLPIVPMTIQGSYTVMPRHRDFHFATWTPLTLTIHKPIPPIGKGDENIKHAMQQSRAAIEQGIK